MASNNSTAQGGPRLDQQVFRLWVNIYQNLFIIYLLIVLNYLKNKRTILFYFLCCFVINYFQIIFGLLNFLETARTRCNINIIYLQTWSTCSQMKCQQIWGTLSVTDSLFFYPEGILRPFSYHSPSPTFPYHSPTLLLSSTRLLSIQSYLCRTLLILNNFKGFFFLFHFFFFFWELSFRFPFVQKSSR